MIMHPNQQTTGRKWHNIEPTTQRLSAAIPFSIAPIHAPFATSRLHNSSEKEKLIAHPNKGIIQQ